LDAWKFLVADEGQACEDAGFLFGYISRMLGAASMICDRGQRLLALIGDVSPDAAPTQSLARLAVLYAEFWPLSDESIRPVEVKDGWYLISVAQGVVLGNFPAGRYPFVFPTHGHCDFASFVWLYNGHAILGDSGRYRYTPDAVSLFQKSAAGHNLPTVNGFAPLCETLVANGSWWPLPYAAAVLELTECDGGVVLAHKGFARATPVRRHSRQILPQEAALPSFE
jgi:hypothetical protein